MIRIRFFEDGNSIYQCEVIRAPFYMLGDQLEINGKVYEIIKHKSYRRIVVIQGEANETTCFDYAVTKSEDKGI